MRKTDPLLQLSRAAVAGAFVVMLVAATVRWTDAVAPDLPQPVSGRLTQPAFRQLPNHAPTAAPDSSALVRMNPFGPERAPPATRFELQPLTPDTISSAAPTAPHTAFEVRLYGVSIGPNGTTALMDADPAVPGAEIYRVGDRFGDNRIVEITERGVVVVGAQGRAFYPIQWNEQRES
ncbi:MAG TPA: hypothetical protein VGD49_09255 [Longimicrobiales bacterium]